MILIVVPKSSALSSLFQSRFVFSPTAWTSIRVPRALTVSTLTGSVQWGPSRTVPSESWPRILSRFADMPATPVSCSWQPQAVETPKPSRSAGHHIVGGANRPDYWSQWVPSPAGPIVAWLSDRARHLSFARNACRFGPYLYRPQWLKTVLLQPDREVAILPSAGVRASGPVFFAYAEGTLEDRQFIRSMFGVGWPTRTIGTVMPPFME